MVMLCLQEEEMLAEKSEKGFSVLYDKRVNVFLKRSCSKRRGEIGRKFRLCRKW